MIEVNKVYNENNLETMKKMKDGSVDLIIADPPYNKKVADWDTYKLEDYLTYLNDFIIECKRILSNQGNLFIYNQQPMASYMFQILHENLMYVDEIIWHYKNGGGNAKKKPKNTHQLLYWFSKSKNYIRNFDEIRQDYSGTRAIYKHNVDKNPDKAWTPNDKGAMITNVWEVSIVRQKQATELARLGIQKPLELGDRIIKLGSNEDSLVYIPFAGSGTEIMNCIDNKRNWISSEMNAEYIEKVIEPRINLKENHT